ncbi:PP2C family protein-serine/threonine phosphatase [Dactylosporangium sp. NPDC000521]|uniref:PP2C family protein-serine/threonine phosphatase n=1 Tax=Dactylosporangium sp. NPDC000521 TaxID=3363975 RepID=UPI0036ACFA1F
MTNVTSAVDRLAASSAGPSGTAGGGSAHVASQLRSSRCRVGVCIEGVLGGVGRRRRGTVRRYAAVRTTDPSAGIVSEAEQLRRLQAVSDAALSRLGVEDLLNELLVRVRELLHADTAAIMLLDSTGTELVATAANGLEREVLLGVRVPLGRGFAGSIAANAQPVIIDHVDATTVASPILISAHLTAMLGVPMLSAGQVIGVLTVGSRTPRRFSAADVELLQLVADRAAHATLARSHSLDRAAAYALQRSLLPDRPPAIPGLDLAVRYAPGSDAGVGGDWYDVFTLPSGTIGVAVGDVAGNGLRAAVVMGRIRSALRAYAMETDDPADVLTRLDRKVHRFEPGAMATVIYAVIDPGLDTVTLSNAGHLPPLAVVPGGPAELLTIGPDMPIGAYPDAPRTAVIRELPPGTGLFFYTDGLVERRHQSILVGLDQLAAAVTDGTADQLCDAAMTKLLQTDQPADDIAILALRRSASG